MAKEKAKKISEYKLSDQAMQEVTALRGNVAQAQKELGIYLRALSHAAGFKGKCRFDPASKTLREV